MAADFKPVQKSNLADDLAERIVAMIRSGDYSPGDRLPAIMEMARRFGVGHPTVREALKKLEMVGAVEIRHGSGVYVSRAHPVLLLSNPVFSGGISKKLMLDLIDARATIETRSAALAAQHATESHLQNMQRLLEVAAGQLHDPEALTAANMAFHREIAVASGNAVLAQVQEVLTNLFQREQRLILDIYGSREKDHDQHVGILDALEQRDPALAEARMKAHLEGVRDVLLRWDPELQPIA